MQRLLYYGYNVIRECEGITIYTMDNKRLKPRGVIIRVLINNLVQLFPDFEAFKKVGSRFAKFNHLNIPIKPQALCDMIEGVFHKDDVATFGNYMYMFMEGVDYVVIFRLSYKFHGSQIDFLQEGFDCNKDYIFVIDRSVIEQRFWF